MEVKGTALKTTVEFVKTKYPEKYNQWIDSLPPKSKDIYKVPIDVSKWYPMLDGYLVPIDKIVELFFNNDAQKGGQALGYYSADIALRGVYKVFLLIASPTYLMSRASTILATFYRPCEIKIATSTTKSVTLELINFTEITPAFEHRMAQWCIRALELTNSKNPAYQIQKSYSKGDSLASILFTWD